MIGVAFKFWIQQISSIFIWAFNLTINDSPKITLGMFLIACAFIGLVISLLLGTDFISLGGSNNSSDIKSTGGDSYVPRHAKGGK